MNIDCDGDYGKSPREVTLRPRTSEVHPKGKSVATKYTNHEETTETASPKWVRHLNCEERAVGKTHRRPVTENETSSTKLLDCKASDIVLRVGDTRERRCLDDGATQSDDRSDENGHLSAPAICKPISGRDTDEGPSVEQRKDETRRATKGRYTKVRLVVWHNIDSRHDTYPHQHF
jgi:hypothetical protein